MTKEIVDMMPALWAAREAEGLSWPGLSRAIEAAAGVHIPPNTLKSWLYKRNPESEIKAQPKDAEREAAVRVWLASLGESLDNPLGERDPDPATEDPVAEAPATGQAAAGEDTWAVSGDSARFTAVTKEPIRTEEDIVRVCQVDLERWRPVKLKCKAYTTPLKIRTPTTLGGKTWLVDEERQQQQYLIDITFELRHAEIGLRTLAEGLIADMKAAAPVYVHASRQRPKGGEGALLLLSFPDAHLGKAAPGYGLDAAMALLMEATHSLLSKASGFACSRVLVVAGNDGIQVDGKQRLTTAGTRVETLCSWQEQFRAYVRVMRSKIDAALEVGPVDVLVCPGNHDENSAWAAGEVIGAAYANQKHVRVMNEERMRKYYRHGVNLLGFTHGKEEKKADLPMIMAHEEPEAWAGTTWREWHVGHLHSRSRSQVGPWGEHEEVAGVIVRRSPALCPPDAWHERHGYVGAMRGAEAHVYSFEAGHEGSFSFNVPAAAARAAA